ncbi:MAG: DUF1549 domain-containing protein, partial [Planctomycetaceae bacterium]
MSRAQRLTRCTASMIVLMTAGLFPRVGRGEEPLPERIDFARDVRPVLSDTCYHCHGPDAGQRQADLRLDRKQNVFGGRDGPRIVTPGRPDESELIRRITAENLGERMPPADSGRSLTIRQIELLRRWIEQGADWETHWAFVPPQRPEVPSEPGRAVPVRGDSPANGRPRLWIRTPIDAFIRDRLQREGLSPSPEADKVTLIRRVTLDLTGLPPTPDEVDDFLADDSPDAYGQVVDRLLASPRYGERMAVR